MTVETRIGGRANGMLHLSALAAETGISVPAFSIIDADIITPLEKAARPEIVPLLVRPNSLPPGITDLWNNIKEPLSGIAGSMLSQLPKHAGPPVLKSSYVANSDYCHLSFAGVGNTVPCKSTDPSALADACAELLRTRYKGYATYYRRAHPAASCLDIAIVAMEHLPEQLVWGTIWGSAQGFVVTCSREDSAYRKYITLRRRLGESAPLVLPNWLRSVEALDVIFEVVSYWCGSGVAGSHFDVEFCIDLNGKPRLVQWRPIPDRTALLLDAAIGGGQMLSGPSPYNSNGDLIGSLKFAQDLPAEIDELRECIVNSRGETWVVPYGGQEVDLFRLLVAVHVESNLCLPPLIIRHDYPGPLGHLHAILPEDSSISSIVHLYTESAVESNLLS